MSLPPSSPLLAFVQDYEATRARLDGLCPIFRQNPSEHTIEASLTSLNVENQRKIKEVLTTIRNKAKEGMFRFEIEVATYQQFIDCTEKEARAA